MIKMLAVPISPVSGFVLKHRNLQRLPQVKPWLGRRASDCVVSGRVWSWGVGCHRCTCLSWCLAQGVCGERAVFTKLNESAMSEWLRLGSLGFPLRDSFLTES